MEDLHADPASLGLDSAGHAAVTANFAFRRELPGKWRDPASPIGGDPPADNQADTAPGAFGEIFGQAGVIALPVFQTGVHRAHQHAVWQTSETQVQRFEQMWISGMAHR
jgi:hypothetical protein